MNSEGNRETAKEKIERKRKPRPEKLCMAGKDLWPYSEYSQ